jgi:hypothetical protein
MVPALAAAGVTAGNRHRGPAASPNWRLTRPNLDAGLLGLKDRAEALGGRLRLDSPPGAGTTLEITVPFDDPARFLPGCARATSGNGHEELGTLGPVCGYKYRYGVRAGREWYG